MSGNDAASVEVRFRHQEKELARHTLRQLIRSQGWIWKLVVVLYVLAIALVLLLVLLNDSSARRMGLALGAVGLLALMVLALTSVIARINARGLLKSSKELSGELLYRFDKDGYEYRSAFSSARVAWEALHAVIEYEDAFLLFPSKAHFVLVPKRGFDDTAALGRFRELLQESVGDKVQSTGA